MSRALRPRACGCLLPTIGRNASLYKRMKSEPQYKTIGCRDSRQMLTVVRSSGDQEAIGPSGVSSHARSAISRLISLLIPLARVRDGHVRIVLCDVVSSGQHLELPPRASLGHG